MSAGPSLARPIAAGYRDVTPSFGVRPNGKFEGLVTGLRLGANRLRAVAPDARGATLTVTNHPLGGPIFSGPQIQPWTCQAGATDKQCDQAPTYTRAPARGGYRRSGPPT